MKIIIALSLSLLSYVAHSQSPILINTLRWDDPVAWQNSSTPTIKAFGEHSDSLKSAYGAEFLYHSSQYYHVTNWADYYLWFTQKYSYLFSMNADLYKFYYESGDNYAMMDYVFNFSRGGNLPTIWVDLGNGQQEDVRSYAFDNNSFYREEKKLRRKQNLAHISNRPSRGVTFIANQGTSGTSSASNSSDATPASQSNGQNTNSTNLSRAKDQ